MSRSICPFKQGYGADSDTYAVSGADVPVNGYVGSVDPKFFRWLDGAPDIMFNMLTYDLSLLLEIWIYRQKIHLPIGKARENISLLF